VREEFEQLTPRARRHRLKLGALPPAATRHAAPTPLAAVALHAEPRPTALLAAASTAASAAVAAAAAASSSSSAAAAAAAAAAPSARTVPALPTAHVLAPPPPPQLLSPPPPPQGPPMRRQFDLVDPSSNQVRRFRPWESDGAAGRGSAGGGRARGEGEGGVSRPLNALPLRRQHTLAEDAAVGAGSGGGVGSGSGAAAKALTAVPPPPARRPRRATSAERRRSRARAAAAAGTSVSRAQAATTTKRYGLETLGEYGELQTDLLDRELAEIHMRERQWADGIAERCTRTTKWLMSAAEGGG